MKNQNLKTDNNFLQLSKILYEEDPMGLATFNGCPAAPPDEYNPEAETILLGLVYCNSKEDVLNLVHEEFSSWFPSLNHKKDDYSSISNRIFTEMRGLLHQCG